MLIHEALQEQLTRERRAMLASIEDERPLPHRRPDAGLPLFVRALVPAFTHGLFGLPAPQRTAHGGC